MVENFCWVPFLKGCGTGAGLIIAIGPQNAFLLKQGILRNHVFFLALFCSVADALLISAGVSGVGGIIASMPYLMAIAKWGGAAFLFYYGFTAFRSAFRDRTLALEEGTQRPTLKAALGILFVLTFFNPHAYLDAFLLLGSIGAQFHILERPYFTIGAIAASFVWFFTLAIGAQLLTPYFQKPLAWKILDTLIGLIMWTIAVLLIVPNGCFCPV